MEGWDYATVKYDKDGVQQWDQHYNGPGSSYDYATSMDVDGAGNVYVSGSSWSEASAYDFATIKYDMNGVQQWARRYNGTGNGWDQASSLAVDGDDNVYVTGKSYGKSCSYDYATIKYDTDGVRDWVKRYNGPGDGPDYPYGIALDNLGGVYVAGSSYGGFYGMDSLILRFQSAP